MAYSCGFPTKKINISQAIISTHRNCINNSGVLIKCKDVSKTYKDR